MRKSWSEHICIPHVTALRLFYLHSGRPTTRQSGCFAFKGLCGKELQVFEIIHCSFLKALQTLRTSGPVRILAHREVVGQGIQPDINSMLQEAQKRRGVGKGWGCGPPTMATLPITCTCLCVVTMDTRAHACGSLGTGNPHGTRDTGRDTDKSLNPPCTHCRTSFRREGGCTCRNGANTWWGTGGARVGHIQYRSPS